MQIREIATELYNQDDADIFAAFEDFHDCTNRTFLKGKLKPVVFSFTRNPRTRGALLPERYASVDGQVLHGISVNSAYCQSIGDVGTMLMSAFLIVQQARRDLGPTGRNGTRGTPGNIDTWSHKVLAGMGIETGVPDSDDERRLGFGLAPQLIEGGPFDLMCRELLVAGFRFRWRETAPNMDVDATSGSGTPPQKAKPQTRAKFECPECGLKALAKPTALLTCGRCNMAMPLVSEAAA